MGTMTSSSDGNSLNVAWVNADNVTDDGTLFTFDIYISPSAPEAEYPIYIQVSDNNTINDKYEPVNIEAQDGNISVAYVERTAEERAEIANSYGEDSGGNSQTVWIICGAAAVCVAAAIIIIVCKKKRQRQGAKK